MIVLLSLLALAADGERAWVSVGAEGLPDLEAGSQERSLLDVGLDLGEGPLRFDAVAGLRQRSVGGELWPRLERAALRLDAGVAAVSAGRIVRFDARGRQRIDGVDVVARNEDLEVRGWAGQIWRPETTDAISTFVAGAEVRWEPERLGQGAWWLGGAAGAEVRASEALRLRVHGAAEFETPRGDRVALLGELDATELDGRVNASVSVPVGAVVTAIGGLRWEGLVRLDVGDEEPSPLQWIAPRGYGLATVGAQWAGQVPGRAEISGVLRPEPDGDVSTGARGRLAWQLTCCTPALELVATGAAVGPSWFVGGGAVARGEVVRTRLSVSGGAWWFEGLDQVPRPIGEVRLAAERDLVDLPGLSLRLRGSVAAGSDRVLPIWLRGGALLTGGWR